VVNVIVDIHRDDPEFGYRLISDELEKAGHVLGEGRVHRLCKRHQIWSVTTKKGRKGSGKIPGPAVHDDLFQRNFTAAHRSANSGLLSAMKITIKILAPASLQFRRQTTSPAFEFKFLDSIRADIKASSLHRLSMTSGPVRKSNRRL
jgi:hypothetical protein